MNRREFHQLTIGAALGGSFLRGVGQAAPPAAPSPADSSGAIRLSFMLWTMDTQASFDHCIEMVAEAGYQGVELVREHQSWSREETARIMGRMRSLGLVFDAMAGMPAGFADPGQSADFLTQLAAQVSAAKELECPKIILMSGKRLEGVSPASQHQTAIENLKRAGDAISKDDMDIVIEPIDALENPTTYLTTVSEGFEIVRAVGNPEIKVLYDIYHEQRGYGNLIEKLEQNIEWVGLVHVADVPGRHEPGTGEIDYDNIYRKLAELKYDKYIAMEFYPTEDPVESLRAARHCVQRAGFDPDKSSRAPKPL